MASGNNGSRRQSAHPWHVYIHDDKVGVEHCDDAKSFRAISSLSHKFHFILRLENSAYHLHQLRSIVYHDEAWTRRKM